MNVSKSRSTNKVKLQFKQLVIAGLVGTLAFDAVMYADIAVTGIPLDVTKVLGSLVSKDSVDLAGHIFHFVDGIGLSLFYGLVFLPISMKLMKGKLLLHGITYAVLITVGPLWLVLLPALGAGIAGINISPLVMVMTIIRHVAFGAVLGILVKRSESIN